MTALAVATMMATFSPLPFCLVISRYRRNKAGREHAIARMMRVMLMLGPRRAPHENNKYASVHT